MRFVFLLLLAPVYSAYGKTIDLQVLLFDIYSEERLTDFEISVLDGKMTHTQEVDEKGRASFVVSSSTVELRVTSKNGSYESLHYEVSMGGTKAFRQILYLYPADTYKNSLTLREDSLYGALDSEDNPVTNPADQATASCQKFQEATFLGGAAAFQRYIMMNVRYPQEAIERDEQGKVYLTFVIETDGAVSHIRVVRGVSMELDREAIRLIRSMPAWQIGTCDGTPSRTIARAPINFTLN